jgi:hypothetical protein
MPNSPMLVDGGTFGIATRFSLIYTIIVWEEDVEILLRAIATATGRAERRTTRIYMFVWSRHWILWCTHHWSQKNHDWTPHPQKVHSDTCYETYGLGASSSRGGLGAFYSGRCMGPIAAAHPGMAVVAATLHRPLQWVQLRGRWGRRRVGLGLLLRKP